jgi:hypothetical protein
MCTRMISGGTQRYCQETDLFMHIQLDVDLSCGNLGMIALQARFTAYINLETKVRLPCLLLLGILLLSSSC